MVNNIPRTKIWEVRSRNTTRVLFESIVPDQLSEERYRGIQGNDTEVGGVNWLEKESVGQVWNPARGSERVKPDRTS